MVKRPLTCRACSNTRAAKGVIRLSGPHYLDDPMPCLGYFFSFWSGSCTTCSCCHAAFLWEFSVYALSVVRLIIETKFDGIR